MSEAWGLILIKAPEGTLPVLGEEDEGYSWEAINQLAKFAGINSLVDSHQFLNTVEGNEFSIEEVPITKQGFTQIEPFGEEWMWLINTLIKSGQHIEIYGSMFHEHNFTELYVLRSDGLRFCKMLDGEGATSNAAGVQIKEEWLAAIPEDVQTAFPDAFDLDDDDDD